ncbi:hypothetical protein [Craterilacuibacter sp.]|uniref:hypothetical protein n=1 Tax=Craterilacuibacter sp. TaxID=2870909 RepID=UPI003F2CD63C
MNDAIRPVSASACSPAIRSRDGGVPLQLGELLMLTLAAQHADGSVLLEGAGLRVLLRWPAQLPAPAPGSAWPFVVRALTPQLELAWPQRVTDRPASPENPAPARGWALDAATLPQLRAGKLSVPLLAQDWQAALTGALCAEQQRQNLRGQRHFSAAWLQAGAGLPEAAPVPALPLSLPFWLWGGPRLWIDLEQGAPQAAAHGLPPAADLVIEIELEEAGPVRLLLRHHPEGVALVMAATAQGCLWLQGRLVLIRAAVREAGLALAVCRVVATGMLPPRLLPASSLPALAAHPLPLPLFEVALRVLLAASPALAAAWQGASPASRSG